MADSTDCVLTESDTETSLGNHRQTQPVCVLIYERIKSYPFKLKPPPPNVTNSDLKVREGHCFTLPHYHHHEHDCSCQCEPLKLPWINKVLCMQLFDTEYSLFTETA